MLRMAGVRRGEVVFDLGAGDGRILIEAVRKFGARAVGVEIDPERLPRLKERLNSTNTNAEVIHADFMDVDLSCADVVVIYLSATANAKLEPKLRSELRAGARVVSLDYALLDWAPDREITVKTAGLARKVYLYRVA